MNIGYIRVSKNEQNQDLQRDAISKAGCELVIKTIISEDMLIDDQKVVFTKLKEDFELSNKIMFGTKFHW